MHSYYTDKKIILYRAAQENLTIWYARHQMIHNYLSGAEILIWLSVVVHATFVMIVPEYYQIKTNFFSAHLIFW
jgi:hypothetical protein